MDISNCKNDNWYMVNHKKSRTKKPPTNSLWLQENDKLLVPLRAENRRGGHLPGE
jgi:hypothetical protein